MSVSISISIASTYAVRAFLCHGISTVANEVVSECISSTLLYLWKAEAASLAWQAGQGGAAGGT